MKKDQQVVRNMKHKFLHAGITMALAAGMMATLPSAYAGGKITIDDTKWISVGMGMRGGFAAASSRAHNGGYGNQFGINNARIYLNGQIHENIKFEFNTESFNVGNAASATGGAFGGSSTIGILDAIAKFEFNRYANLWAGRMLVPTERGELNGPFYHATFEGFKTPFFPQDYSTFVQKSGGAGGTGNGMYGRDNGVTFFGDMDTKDLVGLGHLQYSMGVFTGTRGALGPNQSDSASYAGRLTYNFLNPEKNPGYYTSGTYYGTAGDILAVAVGVNHQKNGAGSLNYRTDFTGVVADVLFEKVLDNNMGVFTFNGEYKRFWANGGTVQGNRAAMFADAGAFGQFSGQSWTAYGLYLIPHKVGIGRFQPYGRYTSVQPDQSAQRTEAEGGMNYVIDGHNARLAAFYQRGNLYTRSLDYSPSASGATINAFKVAFQLQI
ncbi:MAG: hypothetical protein WCP13_05520 [Nitrosomonadaceae bacterium]